MGAALAKLAKKVGIRMARSLLSSEDQKSGKKRKILLPILGGILFLPFLPILLISNLGILFKEYDRNEDVSRPIPETITYAEIQADYIHFNEFLEDTVLERIEHRKKEYTKTVTDEEGNETLVEPFVVKTVSIEKPDLRMVLAHINTEMMEAWRTEREWNYDSDAIVVYMIRSINFTDYCEYDADSHTLHYFGTCVRRDMEEVLEMDYGMLETEKAEEQKDIFRASYASYEDMVAEDTEVTDSQEDINLDLFTTYPVGLAIPQFYQYDPRWGNIPYGDGVISDSGCAPTSMAMVASYMTGRFISPVKTCKFAEEHGMYVNGAGTAWSFFPAAAREYGFGCRQLGSANEVVEALQRGEPVIASMRPGIFTTTGHLIVIRGVTERGEILVVDPYDSERKQFYNREFEPNDFFRQTKAFWAFYGK